MPGIEQYFELTAELTLGILSRIKNRPLKPGETDSESCLFVLLTSDIPEEKIKELPAYLSCKKAVYQKLGEKLILT